MHAVAGDAAAGAPRQLLRAKRGVDVKLRDIAARLSCRLEGDGDIDITRVAALEEAGPGDLTFFANRKYLDELRSDAGVRGDRRAER